MRARESCRQSLSISLTNAKSLAASLMVPGSHLWTKEQRESWSSWLDPERVVPIRVPIGSIMLWRNQTLHAVAP